MGDEAAAAAAVDMQEERAHFAKVLRAWSDYLQYTVRAVSYTHLTLPTKA